MGFIGAFREELPMEYAVELNQLIKMDFGENGIGWYDMPAYWYSG